MTYIVIFNKHIYFYSDSQSVKEHLNPIFNIKNFEIDIIKVFHTKDTIPLSLHEESFKFSCEYTKLVRNMMDVTYKFIS
jgi:hypothetical protein